MKRNGGGIPVNKMRKKIIKPIALILSTVMLASSLVGCGSGDESTIQVPKNTLMKDEYEPGIELTDDLSYQMDYVTNPNNPDSLEVVRLFDHMKVQIDDWPCLTVGVSTLGDVVTTIEQMNTTYVETKTQAVIDERQAEIDKEYEKAKKKAEAKGKEYTKKKKEVRTDDIHFDEPYSYSVLLGKEGNKSIWDEYKATLLVDPSKYPVVQLEIYKYGIPYVLVLAEKNNNFYNYEICQESDWVVTKIEAANVVEYTKTNDQGAIVDLADFVDVDSRNKAAKKNMKMSGNIRFDGEGFNWESLLKLCEALNLEKRGRNYAFVQSSDEQFTYYTIDFILNPYEGNKSSPDDLDVRYPAVRLIATFDPLTQVCLNWSMQSYASGLSYKGKTHELSEMFNVNVQNFQVDTNDYEGMRETIKEWINKNALNLTSAYCAIDETNNKEPLSGIVDTGLTNITIEPVIDGEPYSCLDYNIRENGDVVGSFISHNEMAIAETMEEGDQIKHMEKNTHQWVIKCCMLDAEKNIVGYVEDKSEELINADAAYFIVDYEKTDAGYKNVKVIEEENVQQLLNLYTKTYQLNNEEAAELQDIYRERGMRKVKEHIDEMFREAEEKKKEYDKQNGLVDDTVNEITLPDKQYYKTEQNVDILSTMFKYGDVQIDINELTNEKIESLGFRAGSDFAAYDSELITLSFGSHKHTVGDKFYTSNNRDNEIDAILFDEEMFTYEGVTVGATREDVANALSFAQDIPETGDILLKSDKNAVLFVFEDGDAVRKVILFTSNEIGFNVKNQNDDSLVQEDQSLSSNMTEVETELTNNLKTEAPIFFAMDANTELDLSLFKVDDKEFDVNSLKQEDVSSMGYVHKPMDYCLISDNNIFFAGMQYAKDDKCIALEKTEDNIRSVLLKSDNMSASNVVIGMTKADVLSALSIDESSFIKDDVENIEYVLLKNMNNGLIISLQDEVVTQIQLITNSHMTFDANEDKQVVDLLISDLKNEAETESEDKENVNDDQSNDEQPTPDAENGEENDEEAPAPTPSNPSSGNVVLLLIALVIGFVVTIVLIVAYCKIFKKMGEANWKALVPILNMWVLASNTWASPILGMVGMMIPGVNFIFLTITMFKLYRLFGKGLAFSLIGTLTPAAPICLLILAFGDAEYELE